MVTAILKQILKDSGCVSVIYEQQQLANLYADEAKSKDIIGIIIRPEVITLEVKANAIHEHYNPLTIQIIQQAKLEDKADNNEVQLQALLDICKEIIVRIIAEGIFKTQAPYNVSRILENKYDVNAIGWSVNLDLYYLLNETRNPCL